MLRVPANVPASEIAPVIRNVPCLAVRKRTSIRTVPWIPTRYGSAAADRESLAPAASTTMPVPHDRATARTSPALMGRMIVLVLKNGSRGLAGGSALRCASVSPFDRLEERQPIAIWDGVVARTIDGELCSFAVVELDPSSVVAEHSHPNEQLGMVVRGSVSFRIAEEERELGPGDTWLIPPNTPHEVHTGPGGAVVIDVFAPGRSDWAALERADVRAARWP
jgi:quercetin dioxygenase-like cupin family protein